MRIPTGSNTLIWLPDRKGQFTVRSVYNVLTRIPNYIVGIQPVVNQVWKKLSRVNFPHKVKKIIWKCMPDIVPTRDKIARYKPDIDVYCSLCNHPLESVDHLLLNFSYSRSVWLAININVDNIITQHGYFKKWVISWFSVGSNLIFGAGINRQNLNNLLMLTAWTIWKDRCYKIFQNINPNRDFSLDNIHKLTKTYTSSPTNVNRILQIQRWIPPVNDYFKINFDASFMEHNLQGGIGLIVRNFAGICIGVQGDYFDGGITLGIEVEELEWKAMLVAVNYAVERGFNKVVFESDSQVLIKSINEQTFYVHWMNQSLVLDIKFLLSKLAQCSCVRALLG
ncbi:uncharacterized protein LOC113315872 [Papaver somniferum]|uniref:uncharacterized protein LOC113315872 n=1 Tax=Papaver somniferum TaxID=3469 RepID=UPI000E701605|nr:uncharacterized protein LOC113315872 [Papaver somniferum]